MTAADAPALTTPALATTAARDPASPAPARPESTARSATATGGDAAAAYPLDVSRTVAGLVMLGVGLAEDNDAVTWVVRQMRPQLDRLQPAHWESVSHFTTARRARLKEKERFGR